MSENIFKFFFHNCGQLNSEKKFEHPNKIFFTKTAYKSIELRSGSTHRVPQSALGFLNNTVQAGDDGVVRVRWSCRQGGRRGVEYIVLKQVTLAETLS